MKMKRERERERSWCRQCVLLFFNAFNPLMSMPFSVVVCRYSGKYHDRGPDLDVLFSHALPYGLSVFDRNTHRAISGVWVS